MVAYSSIVVNGAEPPQQPYRLNWMGDGVGWLDNNGCLDNL